MAVTLPVLALFAILALIWIAKLVWKLIKLVIVLALLCILLLVIWQYSPMQGILEPLKDVFSKLLWPFLT